MLFPRQVLGVKNGIVQPAAMNWPRQNCVIFFDCVSNDYSFHIFSHLVEELWTKSYGKHLEKSSFLKFQFCLLSQLFLIKTEESLEKFNSRRGIGKTNNTVHAQELRQASPEIVDLNFHLLGELGPLFCAYMQS